MRNATKEERLSVNEYVKNISKRTGINFFDETDYGGRDRMINVVEGASIVAKQYGSDDYTVSNISIEMCATITIYLAYTEDCDYTFPVTYDAALGFAYFDVEEFMNLNDISKADKITYDDMRVILNMIKYFDDNQEEINELLFLNREE